MNSKGIQPLATRRANFLAYQQSGGKMRVRNATAGASAGAMGEAAVRQADPGTTQGSRLG